ncbi:MAG: hypothetical protein ACJ78G_11885 [Gemmatimonadaceae bacterium]
MHRLTAVLLIVPCAVACAQRAATTTPRVEREVRGNTIVSNALPAADITIADEFRYVGSQAVNIYGSADAEQHLFVAGPPGRVERLYWVQFEHYLPTNNDTYDYRPDRTTEIGGLQFIYDVATISDYAGAPRDPRSDGAAVIALLAKQNLALPTKAARVRMIHLPSADRRSELMIIYGEALSPESRTPVSAEGTSLDAESPAEAKLFLERAVRGLTIRRH